MLHLASANRHCEVVKRLVEAGGRVNARNSHGNTPVHSAAATGTVDVLSVSLVILPSSSSSSAVATYSCRVLSFNTPPRAVLSEKRQHATTGS